MSPDDTSITIRRARAEDASALSAFAARVFRETFGPYTPPADLAAHLASTYTPDREATAIADPCTDIFLAETLSSVVPSVLIGYVHVCQTTLPECVRGPTPIELKRLYVDTSWHGRGVAQQLMEEALRAALGLRPKADPPGVTFCSVSEPAG